MSEPEGARGAYEKLTGELRETAVLESAGSILAWDQETGMPARGSELRAAQVATLSTLVHERRTRPEVEQWLAECEADPELTADEAIAANLRWLRHDHDRDTKLPTSLVREIARTNALALQAWRNAREASDFSAFAPWLEKVFALSRSKAECLRGGEGGELYDVLMEEYEPGAEARSLERVFGELRSDLAPLIAEIGRAERSDAGAGARVSIPVPRQMELSRRVAERLGFDFDAGRLDVSTHPFCEGVGPGDTRLTTRFSEDLFFDALSSTMHEAGHGLYEQGLPKEEHFGQPLAEAASLGIHESQSRLWENFVGRSRPFWSWALPLLQESAGEAAGSLTVESVFRAVNRVRPSLIRVESDEATYNLHIMLRFDLERALLAGDFAVADLPGEWNERMRQDLGVEVPDDRRGCLQDIHWSMGAVGYFPTYTLGNLYAAQLWEAVRADNPGLDEEIGRGEFGALLGWLRDRIHRHGRRFTAAQLCERATGSPLSAAPFVNYLKGKYGPIYGI